MYIIQSVSTIVMALIFILYVRPIFELYSLRNDIKKEIKFSRDTRSIFTDWYLWVNNDLKYTNAKIERLEEIIENLKTKKKKVVIINEKSPPKHKNKT